MNNFSNEVLENIATIRHYIDKNGNIEVIHEYLKI